MRLWAGAHRTPIGYLPDPGDVDTTDLDISDQSMTELNSIDAGQWQAEIASIGE